ncbi:MAG: EAL domain-containing protein [Nitrospinae bacterium]|nr:EAL domain-containing protein [Nitrospinota bacterium]
MDEALKQLLFESRDHLSLLESLQQGTPSAKQIEEMVRAAHSIKGGFSFFEKPNIVKLSLALEKIFKRIGNRELLLTPELKKNLETAIGKLRLMVEDLDNCHKVSLHKEMGPLLACLEEERPPAGAKPESPVAEPGPLHGEIARPPKDELPGRGMSVPEDMEILIVEDSPTQARILEKILSKQGFKTFIAFNGAEGLSIIRRRPPKLVITDVVMPVLGGYELSRALKDNPVLKNIPVILVSSLDDSQDIIRGLHSKADFYITKPYHPEFLLSKVKELLAHRQRADETDPMTAGISIGGVYSEIDSPPQQILNFLHSTYENSIQQKRQLAKAQAELQSLNDRLEEKIKERTRELEASQTNLRRLIEKNPDGIVVVDSRKNVRFVNPVAERFLGGKAMEFQKWLREFRLDGETGHEMEIHPDKGHAVLLEARAVKTEWEGEPSFLVILRDITERRKAEATIRRMAFYDDLTGLPNRALLIDRLEHCLKQAKRENKMLAVIALGLDNFKTINDTLGHSFGDLLLKAMARRLEQSIRKGDTVSRFGGDAFVLLLSAVGSVGEITHMASRIQEIIQPSFIIEDRELFVTASFGIAFFPEDGAEPQTLIKNADIALYRAKESGRNTYQMFTATMNERIVARMELESRLRKAQQKEELEIHYQPQVDLATGRIIGMEALIRWPHPERGMVPPAKFIPVAEETGLIVPIGEWVLRKSCEQGKRWEKDGFPGLRMGVNVSARQFQGNNLVHTVEKVLRETGLPPHCLELEITESLLMKDADSAVDVLGKLNKLGVSLSIDDFGTGYSSLSYLRNLPISTLKIDQSFIREVARNVSDSNIVRAIVNLGQGLNLKLIAEGVETREQVEFLRNIKCDEIQGYYFSKPLPQAEFTKLLKENKCLPRN